MLYEFRMPDTGANEVELLGWEVREGDEIKAGAVICRVLSGKAELEIHCPQAGAVLKQVARISDHLRPGQLVAILRPEGIPAPKDPPPLPHAEDLEKDHPLLLPPPPKPVPQAPAPVSPPPPAQSSPLPPVPGPMPDLPALPVFKKPAEQTPPMESLLLEPIAAPEIYDVHVPEPPKAAPPAPQPVLKPEHPKAAPPAPQPVPKPEPPKASPPAPQPAPKAEPPKAASPAPTPIPAALPPKTAAPVPPPPPALHPDGERIPFVGPRKRAADKARQSWNGIPHGYGLCEADATALRALMKELAPEAHKRGCELTETAFALRALAKALHEHPEFNSHMDEDGKGMTLKRSCDIGVALTVGHAVIAPVIREVQKKDLWTVAAELAKLPVRAREHNIPDGELHGSSFTVTFVAHASSSLILPVIQHPETAALGVTKPQERAVVIGGGIHARWRMTLGLSYDRRAHDPGRAAVFLSSLARRFEAPRSLE